MITFTKKMVKGIIDVITSEPCKSREALQSLRVKRDGYAYITNGYMAVRFKFQVESIPKDDKQEEFVIPAYKLVYWYRNAKAKDYLNELSILELQTNEDIKQYPDISKLFNEKIEYSGKSKHRFNAKLLEQFCNCAGENNVEIQGTLDGEYVKSVQDEQIDGIIMGIR